MKDELILKDRLMLLEKELSMAAEKIDALKKALEELNDIKTEIKAIKLYLGRVHPEFKNEFPLIVQKLK
jgi:hypothetical protein